MREIKFRAWDIDWTDNDPESKQGRMMCWEEIEQWQIAQLKRGQHFIFMQYTGFKDRHGKEIYDGDILFTNEYTHPSGRVIKKGNYVVEFHASSFGIYREEGYWFLADFGYQVAPKYGITNTEIIGNIYDNPELLNPHTT